MAGTSSISEGRAPQAARTPLRRVGRTHVHGRYAERFFTVNGTHYIVRIYWNAYGETHSRTLWEYKPSVRRYGQVGLYVPIRTFP
jgi:hypothetical protein